MLRKRLIRIFTIIAVLLCAFLGWQGWEGLRPGSPPRWRQVMADGRQAVKAGRFCRAERKFQAAVQEARKFHAPDARLADSVLALADLYQYERFLVRTQQLDQSPWQTRLKKASTKGLRAVLTTMEQAGDAAHAQKVSRHPEKITLRYQQALAIYPKAYTADDVRLAQAYHAMGFGYCQLKRDAAGVRLLQQSAQVYTRAYGNNSLKLVPPLNNISTFLIQRNRVADALPYREQILQTLVAAYGQDDARTVEEMHKLANWCCTVGKYTRAAQLHRQMLARAALRNGNVSVKILPALTNLARVYRLAKQYAPAERLYRRGIVIAERAYGMPYTRMTDPDLYGTPQWEYVRPLLDSYAWQLGATGRTTEASAMWMRLTD